ncbi:MAG: AarF/UbiB family protein, partial [Pseudomonadota bacterium]|nr:AarF/UbiB family protein [Pseudomonadota bacterium]
MFRFIRHTAGLLSVIRILARHDALFPDALAGTSPVLGRVASLISRRDSTRQPGQRLAAALQQLGPSFVKLGQTLSTRPDILGQAIALDLAELQDRLPPFPASQAVATIEQELGQPVASLFTAFDPVPVAAASIAQVHFATVREPDGAVREVAVKVLRPGIERAFRRDLELFRWLADMADRWLPDLRRLKPGEVVDLMARTVRLEMNLRMEAAAAAELAENFRGDPTFRIPAVDWDRTSIRVLTTDRVRGIPVDEVDRLRAAGHNPDTILQHAALVFFRQVFRDGFFHADLHPGNLFVNDQGTLTAVDFGIMGRLDRATRCFLADMLVGFLKGDYARVSEVHFEAGYVPPDQDAGLFT